MSECSSEKCSLGENLNRGRRFKLKCAGCGHEEPLSYQRKSIVCPACGMGILYWVPNNKEAEKVVSE